MDEHISETDHRILDLLYHYKFIWQSDLQKFLNLSQAQTGERVRHLIDLEYIQSKRLPGESRRLTLGLTNKGFSYLKSTFDFHHQWIEDYELRFSGISDGFLRHECLVSYVASRFNDVAREMQSPVYDRRSFLEHLPEKEKSKRNRDVLKPLEVRPFPGNADLNQIADDILYFPDLYKRPNAVFVEIDRGTESARDRYGRPFGKVSKMFKVYLKAWDTGFYQMNFGRQVRPFLLVVISTEWSAETRRKNFIDLWKELSGGRAWKLPKFITLDEFKNGNPIELLYK